MYEIEHNDRCNDVFQYHNNSRQWEENENCVEQEEYENIDQFNYTSNKKYDVHVRQPPVHRQRKVCVVIKIIFYLCILNFIQ